MSATITLNVRCDSCDHLMSERGVWPYYSVDPARQPTLAVRFLCVNAACTGSFSDRHKKFTVDIPFTVQEDAA